MNKVLAQFEYEVYESFNELSAADKQLVTVARNATANAYAPYSNFNVAAAALLTNGQIVEGTNQENASFPVGICAERVVLAAVASQFPGTVIDTMAISYNNHHGTSSKPISPCGMCRQALTEFENRQHQPIRVILTGMQGSIYIIKEVKQLLPLHFSSSDLKEG
ncbi:cytidine deaminase [Panacibacter sp. DH6]|uniref:Cytidine deaminase n=1 Tax=Panacibacter microcysteis TaxID=2793269 RepID=A0A931GYU2_9BACT|nr:cytidine deaminase [Panacibacter microcysteis]MBG9377787.1 cytidine deaminase [Panacibacter microcysteis]